MFGIVGENLTVRLRKIIFSRMLRQDIGWFDLPENKVGVLTSRLAVDATIVRGVRIRIIKNVHVCVRSTYNIVLAYITSRI